MLSAFHIQFSTAWNGASLCGLPFTVDKLGVHNFSGFSITLIHPSLHQGSRGKILKI